MIPAAGLAEAARKREDSSRMESLRLPVRACHGADVEHGCRCTAGLLS